jgi:hypothetical protein
MSDGASVLGREQLVKNMTNWKAAFVAKIATQVEIIQSKVVDHARAGHGKGAHGRSRFETQTGGLEESIQPGKVYITESVVRGVVEARMPYASFVEAHYPFMVPAIAAHGQEFRNRLAKLAGER